MMYNKARFATMKLTEAEQMQLLDERCSAFVYFKNPSEKVILYALSKTAAVLQYVNPNSITQEMLDLTKDTAIHEIWNDYKLYFEEKNA